MIKFTVFLLFASCAFAGNVKKIDGITPRKLPPIDVAELLSEETFYEIKETLENQSLGDSFIQADVTEYATKIISNLNNVIVEEGFEPLELSYQKLDLFPTGYINLTDGWLQGLSTLKVYDSVIAKYSSQTNVLEVTIPLGLDNIMISYDYHTQITLISIKGTVDGKVSDVKVNLHLGFNFTSYQAFVDKADIKDSGHISVKFTGLGLLDWIIDLMSGVVTTLFHGIILGVVNALIQDPVQSAVEQINELIHNFLHPNQTVSFSPY